MVEYEEKALIRQAQEGDQKAIGMLYALHYQAVYNYVFHRVSDIHTAEDLSADVFIRMVHKLPAYIDRGRPLLAWLYTIARNLVADHHRGLKKNLLSILDDEQDPAGRDPHQEVEDQQEQDCFRAALKLLPESQRQLLIYRFIDGYPTQEIMTLLDKSDRAVRSLQHRALRSLRKALDEEDCL